ncbi:hypothetical protein PR048_004868 [Dryococelus australis]|uniref:Uncharacterized protein n=1 Tax=Dryococelus australis TaxID=614101 RepID=A0ABQ9I6M3_9NEOP|nr:hypothetical protein PR048_004868 [Dryococelus australis]
MYKLYTDTCDTTFSQFIFRRTFNKISICLSSSTCCYLYEELHLRKVESAKTSMNTGALLGTPNSDVMTIAFDFTKRLLNPSTIRGNCEHTVLGFVSYIHMMLSYMFEKSLKHQEVPRK